jgi:threonine synthase
VVFVPRSAPAAKLAQMVVLGSTVVTVDGSYDEAYTLCLSACAEWGWYNRCTGFNPYMTEGKKTVALEIAAQLARGTEHAFVAPDAVFVAVGDGCILGGVHKGFGDLLALGLIAKMPRLFGVQSLQSAALYDAFRDGAVVPAPVRATTRADSINVNIPHDAFKALRAVRETGGRFVGVDDDDILQALLSLGRAQGIFTEPAAAAALAGVAAAHRQGWVDPGETLVFINSGNGLKDPQAATDRTPPPILVGPNLDALQRALQERQPALCVS